MTAPIGRTVPNRMSRRPWMTQRLDRNSRPRPASRHFNRHGVARAERPRRCQPADAPARAGSGGQARLFPQSVGPEPAAWPDRSGRHDRAQRHGQHPHQHGVPLRPRRVEASARRTRSRPCDLSGERRRRPPRPPATADRARPRRRSDHCGHGGRRSEGRLSGEARETVRRVRPNANVRAPRVGRSRFRGGGRGRDRTPRRARAPADRAGAARPSPKLSRSRRDRLPACDADARPSASTTVGTFAARRASAAVSTRPTRC